jgi:hypothetical protein
MDDSNVTLPTSASTTTNGILDRSEPSGDGSNIDLTASLRHKIAQLDGHRSIYASVPGSVSPPSSGPMSLNFGPVRPPISATTSVDPQTGLATEVPLRPYPYFFYKDFSGVRDPDPLTPLTGKLLELC